MTDWFESTGGHLARTWERLGLAVSDRTGPAREPVLSTTAPGGAPEARVVILRRADADAGLVEAWSDARTGKIAALTADPRAALTVWLPDDRLQIRLAAMAEILAGAAARPVWDDLPGSARDNYGTAPAPGTPISSATGYARGADPAAFALLRLRIDRIETLHLGEPQRRAAFARQDGWSGTWLVP